MVGYALDYNEYFRDLNVSELLLISGNSWLTVKCHIQCVLLWAVEVARIHQFDCCFPSFVSTSVWSAKVERWNTRYKKLSDYHTEVHSSSLRRHLDAAATVTSISVLSWHSFYEMFIYFFLTIATDVELTLKVELVVYKAGFQRTCLLLVNCYCSITSQFPCMQ